MPDVTQVPLTDLTAAVLTPFDPAAGLSLATVERRAELLLADGVVSVYFGGTTGEFNSLNVCRRGRRPSFRAG